MDATRPETDSNAEKHRQAIAVFLDRPLMKYVGFALLLAWHYTLWFIPDFFFDVQLLDDRVTVSWIVSLLGSSLFLFLIAALLGRKRRLSDCRMALPVATAVAVAGTLALGFLPFQLAAAPAYFAIALVISAAEAVLWILWGERYACIDASFTINRIGTVFGLTLFLCVLIAYLLPSLLAAPFAALLPLVSGLALGVSFVTLFACAACCFLSCIIPWEQLPTSDDSFSFGILGGALFILVIVGIYTLSRNHLNIFKIYPALLVALMVGFALFLSTPLLWLAAFVIGIGIHALFEVLLIMYFGILTTKGYATPALTFAMAGGFVRLGLAAGNSLALWYESMPLATSNLITPPTCLGFMCLLVIVLIPLVRMEFSIVALTAAPPTKNEVEEICAEVAAEFALSAREGEILLLIARGHTTNSMADKLVISPYTVNTHIRHIYDKMQIHKRSELLNYLNMQRSDF